MLWWSMIEASLGLVVACLPVIRPLLGKAKVARMPGKNRGDGQSQESQQRLFVLEPYPGSASQVQRQPQSLNTPSSRSFSDCV
ncbi:hypothetical protein BO70DRAFT_359819 [Aspergillus heteromorphus CBS 117.55]|uniref:Secreted protein n=1 Tax=Aspergillus heteromorphus CBS 117.55 TaxID=1448321 RepID=A0A317WQP7_9EURO|nr:uncharacterized protein BO70DRAFT_359819 [Aspergillus heteromorphus CBS 117.55]PWY88385.1 hypothetical protein BO70DRAFT_359819 [Aspergillus heteromorphus CBS 117.55]